MNIASRLLTALLLTALPGMVWAGPPPEQTKEKTVSLFDGKTLGGWEGNAKIWRVEDGMITGGSLTQTVERNEFVATEKRYANFDLRLKVKIQGTEGFINSGIQIRSERVPNDSEMSGYQCDAGDGWWGKIYDESRRNKVIANPADDKALTAAIKKNDWNDYVIRAEGPRIRIWINGVEGSNYIEPEAKIPLEGHLGLQVHGGGKALVQFKDITIEELPATPKREGAAEPKKPEKESPVPAEEQKVSFTLPPGFEMELVVEENEAAGIGKFVAVHFDAQGRLWTMTALEYPVDANENPAAADALYASKARDKVLVYDIEDRGQGGAAPRYARQPRVFADGLAIPLGILPWKDGCYVQHGHDLALLRDTDGDGVAEKREVVLSGFGVQDSHLFPHQFTRAPGGWIWLAQGAFNYGKVRGTDSKETQFDQTRMARFRPDGSSFEITSNGPCNIWGLVLNGEGEAFIQEANDFGYPVMPFHDYANYPGCSNGQWKSYAPEFPQAAEFRMGGTGLSGLALTDATGAYPPEWSDVMLVANPITRKINSIKMHRDGSGGWKLELLPDFVQSGDEWFRPVAMTLGPDGCVYIVDWYNKIISHNEVPRNHPERDKKRGRIWRVKYKDQQCFPVPDFTKLPELDLVAKLGGASLAQAHLAWQTLADKETLSKETVVALKQLASGEAKTSAPHPDAARIQALWVLREITNGGDPVTNGIASPNANVRREAIANSLILAVTHKGDADPGVRAARIQEMGLAIAEQAAAVPAEVMIALLEAAPEPLEGPVEPSSQSGKPIKTGVAYTREFERYLVRMFLEQSPVAVAAFLNGDAAPRVSAEKRMLACLALPARESAPQVARLIGELGRAPNDEEILRLAEASAIPEVRAALEKSLVYPAAVDALLRHRTRFDAAALTDAVSQAVKRSMEYAAGEFAGKDEKRQREEATRAARLIVAFQLHDFERAIINSTRTIGGPFTPQEAAELLRQLGPQDLELLKEHAKMTETAPEGSPARVNAFDFLSWCRAPGAAAAWIKYVPELPASVVRGGMERLSASKENAAALVRVLTAPVDEADKAAQPLLQAELDAAILDRLTAMLGESDAGMKALMEKMGSAFRPVLVLDGSDDSWIDEPVTLEGPFTVECWVKLAPGIGNEDSILGGVDEADFNFFNSQFRVWIGGGAHDVIAATKPIAPDLWTHVAATRDAQGHYRIYINGEPDAAIGKTEPRPLRNLRIGHSTVGTGTQGSLTEFRVWNVCRSAEEIRAAFDRTLAGEQPAGLIKQYTGTAWGRLHGSAKTAKTADLPAVLTAEEAAAREVKYTKYHALATRPGDAAQGKLLATVCMGCHTINGTGAMLGPNLSGAGAMGTEGLLRNLLSPNAAMEPGYRVYRVELTDGSLKEGFLVSEDPQAIVFRQQGMEDQRIPRAQITRAQYLRRSLMPEGLLEAFSDEQISDLFSYLMTLK